MISEIFLPMFYMMLLTLIVFSLSHLIDQHFVDFHNDLLLYRYMPFLTSLKPQYTTLVIIFSNARTTEQCPNRFPL